MWKIRKTVKRGEYLYAVVPEHPKATKHGYVLEHRVVMENNIGRVLLTDELVHHIDGNGHNNDIENLKLITRKKHSILHSTKYPNGHYVKLCCKDCGKRFKRKYTQRPEAKGYKNAFCSRSCSAKFYKNFNKNK